LRKARKIVAGYTISINPEDRSGFVGSAYEFPTASGRGKTREECLKATQEVLAVAVATMLHLGGTPPEPASQKRTVQVNVRLTQREKVLLSKLAASSGFKGLSQYIRTSALNSAKKAAI
jgi:predicted RNase H-like HicB family nuclease